jgi:hypothetical protein
MQESKWEPRRGGRMKFRSGGKAEFYRGDDDGLLVGLKNGVFAAGDKVFFSLKAQPTDTVDIFQLESEEFVDYLEVPSAGCLITIPHSATIDLELDDYYYDILIRWADGTQKTVVSPTLFTLSPGGSHESL